MEATRSPYLTAVAASPGADFFLRGGMTGRRVTFP